MLALLLAGCEVMYRPTPLDRLFEPQRFARPAPVAEPVPEPVAPEPPAETVVAMDPLPDPPPVATPARAAPEPAVPETEEARLRRTLRRNPWLARFWSDLSASQQLRVERQLGRTGDADAAGAWDSMGLADRMRLVFGPGLSPEQPSPAERREGSSWASRP